MSKPIIEITITTVVEEKSATVNAVFDTGSFYTLLREGRLPPGASIQRYKSPQTMKTAAQKGSIRVIGVTELILAVENKMIRDSVLISPDLSRDMLIGAKTMQAWDISILNKKGRTRVVVGRDMRDPDITEVD